MALSMGPLPVTQAWTAKPNTASIPNLALRTWAGMLVSSDVAKFDGTSHDRHTNMWCRTQIATCRGHVLNVLEAVLLKASGDVGEVDADGDRAQ